MLYYTHKRVELEGYLEITLSNFLNSSLRKPRHPQIKILTIHSEKSRIRTPDTWLLFLSLIILLSSSNLMDKKRMRSAKRTGDTESQAN